jgi:hypothetical protein
MVLRSGWEICSFVGCPEVRLMQVRDFDGLGLGGGLDGIA